MHYFGICICGPENDPATLMAPFDENDEAYMVEEIGEEACAEEYESEKAMFHISPEGRKWFKWDSPHKPYWTGDWMTPDREYITPELPEGWREEELPLTDYYPNIGEFLEHYKGYQYDDKRNVHYTRYNPNGKYDYMRVGGRWQGNLKAKDGWRCDENCWEVNEWLKEHPGESYYGPNDFDWALLDDLIKDEMTTPYFAVLPGGEWLEKQDWGEPDRVWDGDKVDADDFGKWRDAFWSEVVEPYIDTGCMAYAIDIHD